MARLYLLTIPVLLIVTSCSESELATRVKELAKSRNGTSLITLLLDRAASEKSDYEEGIGVYWSGPEWKASDAIIAIASSSADEHAILESILLEARKIPRSPAENHVAKRLLYYINKDLYEQIENDILDVVLARLVMSVEAKPIRLRDASSFPSQKLARGTAVDALIFWWHPDHPNADIGNSVSLAVPGGPTAAELEAFREMAMSVGVIHKRRVHRGNYVGCEGSAYQYVTDLFVVDLNTGVKAAAKVLGSEPPVLSHIRSGQNNCDASGSWPDHDGYLRLRETSNEVYQVLQSSNETNIGRNKAQSSFIPY